MNIQYCLTELHKIQGTDLNFQEQSSTARQSLLVKGQYGEKIGYAEYTPWESLGQKSIEKVLSEYKSGENSFLTDKIKKDINIFNPLLKKELPMVQNHSFFFKGKKIEISKELVKVKLSGKIDSDLEYIKNNCQNYKGIRLDANFAIKENQFVGLYEQLIKEIKIDYIEDPTPWSLTSYKKMLDANLPIALDQPFNNTNVGENLNCPYIFKPSVKNNQSNNDKYIFSSNFGHPLGNWHDYCQLVHSGDLNITHGIFAPTLYQNWPSPFEINKNKIQINPEIVKNTYLKLEKLPWKDI